MRRHSPIRGRFFTSLLACVSLAVLPSPAVPTSAAETADSPAYVLVIHGGAGVIRRQDLDTELEARYRAELEAALAVGSEILAGGGSALDAVESTIRLMEDSPLFNAGKGAVFTAAGTNEMDASIMDGAARTAGAVASVTTIKHPISAARKVMENTRHVLLIGGGADEFAGQAGLEIVDPSYFRTERRWQQLQKAREREAAASTDRDGKNGNGPYFGTVGALALDRHGRLAAGTSTGGLTHKMRGRVGDSPILGAGTWADDRCAVSGTGHGESFMRYLVAYDICARSRYQGSSLAEAADGVVQETLVEAGGDGGVIALAADGSFHFSFNTEGMYRGVARSGSRPTVAIFADESLVSVPEGTDR